MTAPDCQWCDTAQALERIYGSEGDTYYLCPCCGKTTRVDPDGRAHKQTGRKMEFDVLGNLIDPAEY